MGSKRVHVVPVFSDRSWAKRMLEPMHSLTLPVTSASPDRNSSISHCWAAVSASSRRTRASISDQLMRASPLPFGDDFLDARQL